MIRGAMARWRRALALSVLAHAVLGGAVLFLPGSRETHVDAQPGERPRLSMSRTKGNRLSTASAGCQGGTEESDFAGGSLASPLLIEPRLHRASARGDKDLGPRPSRPGIAGVSDGPGAAGSPQSASPGKTTSFFGIGTPAQRIVYVIDASASMGKEGLWDRASRELLRSLDELDGKARFQVVVYNSKPRSLLPAAPGWLRLTPSLREDLRRALDQLTPEGQTDHATALSLALSLRPEVIFFLTDADDLSLSLLAQVDAWNRLAEAVIHGIELRPRRRVGAPLQLLVSRHRGEYRSAAGVK